MPRSSVLVFLLFAASLSEGRAQTRQAAHAADASRAAEATLSGLVTDPTGAVIPGARLTLRFAGSEVGEVSATSGPAGSYTLTAHAGAAKIMVIAAGFAAYTSGPVELVAGKRRTLNLQLKIDVAEQQVEVRGDSLAASDPANNGDRIVLKGSALKELPTDSTQLMQQLQGLSGGPSPELYVDGFSGGTLPPKDTIREIRINQNPYSAQNDTNPVNGMIEVFTKPGSEKLHGEFSVFGEDSALDSRNAFATQTPAYYTYSEQGELGGPINKRSSWFVSAGRRSYQGNAIVAAQVLDGNLNQTSLAEAVVAPNTDTNFSLRYDVSVGTKSTVTARYDFDRTGQTNGGVGQLTLASEGFNSDATRQTVQVSNSQIVSPKIVNDTRFQYIRTRSDQTPVSFAPTVIVQGAFNGGGSGSGAVRDNFDRYELQNYVTASEGKHYLDFGGRLRGYRDANESQANYNGEYIFATLAAYQITQQGVKAGRSPAEIRAAGGGASEFFLSAGKPGVAVSMLDLGLFVQDDWKVRKDFTLSAGLRFESQTSIADHADWAPRVGFNWGLGGKKDKAAPYTVHGGAGVFYHRFAYSSLLQVERENGVTQQQYVIQAPDFYPDVPAPATLAASAPSSVYSISPDFHSPYYFATMLAVDRRFGSYGTVSARWTTNRGVHTQLTRNINAPLPGTYDPADPTSGTRPYGGTENINQFQSEGIFRAQRLAANFNVTAKSVFMWGYYQLLSQHTDSDGGFPSNQYDLSADYGRAANDTRNNFDMGASVPLLFQFRTYTYVSAESGSPFDITLGQDLNGDSQYNDRPSFATDLTRSSVVATRYGVFDTAPIAGQRIIAHNYGQGPGQFSVYLGVFRGFSFGPEIKAEGPGAPLKPGAKPPKPERRYSLNFSINAQNVFNHLNLANPVGTLTSPLFGQSTSLANGNQSGNRQVNLQTYFSF